MSCVFVRNTCKTTDSLTTSMTPNYHFTNLGRPCNNKIMEEGIPSLTPQQLASSA